MPVLVPHFGEHFPLKRIQWKWGIVCTLAGFCGVRHTFCFESALIALTARFFVSARQPESWNEKAQKHTGKPTHTTSRGETTRCAESWLSPLACRSAL